MSTLISPLAGRTAPSSLLVDVDALCAAYFDLCPDPSVAAHRVAFGTTGHRGISFERSFNEWHVLAITQAICDYRRAENIVGPLFLGIDTHALSTPAYESALEVLAGNGVSANIAAPGQYTPTPAVSRAIVAHNRDRRRGLADGIVITPSHNPPDYGGFKYNPPNGGPAETAVTAWIQARANALIEGRLREVRRLPAARARRAGTARVHDFLGGYVADLDQVIDFDVIRSAGVRIGVDPMGGAGMHYWQAIAERYGVALDVISTDIDPRFAFIPVDWDGRIRMDPSSAHAMRRLIDRRHDYDIAIACDTDHDRHGVVTPAAGLLPSNHYLCVMIDYLFRHRTPWPASAAIGKTIVSSALIDRLAGRLGRKVHETPAGFKWFANGLADGSLGFGGEESAGASFLCRDGDVWTTDKDGMTATLLAAEITARTGRDPGEYYRQLVHDSGEPLAERIDASISRAQRTALSALEPAGIPCDHLAGERIERILDRAPGNGERIGGIKVIAASGWFAARPSGTENICKIYAESFRDATHLAAILAEAQQIVGATLASAN